MLMAIFMSFLSNSIAFKVSSELVLEEVSKLVTSLVTLRVGEEQVSGLKSKSMGHNLIFNLIITFWHFRWL